MRVNEMRSCIRYLEDFKENPFEWKIDLVINLLKLNLQQRHEQLGESAIPDMAKILLTMLRGGAADSEEYARNCLRSLVDNQIQKLQGASRGGTR